MGRTWVVLMITTGGGLIGYALRDLQFRAAQLRRDYKEDREADVDWGGNLDPDTDANRILDGILAAEKVEIGRFREKVARMTSARKPAHVPRHAAKVTQVAVIPGPVPIEMGEGNEGNQVLRHVWRTREAVVYGAQAGT